MCSLGQVQRPESIFCFFILTALKGKEHLFKIASISNVECLRKSVCRQAHQQWELKEKSKLLKHFN